ncbi:MAG: ROK family transcriptional regulator [Spirochaetales bacterium]|uniref:ROK family transcriptional regulator n=1 Tax=Candidatus Thalassospirochaeta sargassi TaxID=3119039 RepID=A0AAJ1MNV9_9SPIO|nr:ROK family transcriptional regulator [Spirochaetales bacterium]
MESSNRLSTKQNNRKLILDLFRQSDVLSVADINSSTGISKPTVQKVINHFTESGLILSEGKGASTEEGGKKPLLYSFNREYGFIICIHLGPDFFYSAIADLGAEIIHSEFMQVGSLRVGELLELCAEKINAYAGHDAVLESRLISVSIALPGIVEPESGKLVFLPHFPEIAGNYPFLDELKALMSVDAPVYFDNINRLQAFAEMKIGAAAGKENFMIIDAMEEGLGSGIIVKGELKHGAHNFSGEVGHMVLMPKNGPRCICGGRGCFEALVNLKRINLLVEEGRVQYPDSAVFRNEKHDKLQSRLLEAFKLDDPLAISVLDEIAFWFASGINNAQMINDPELIIMEGIYNPFGESFVGMIKAHLSKMAFPDIERPLDIQFSGFGVERGILGAAAWSVWSFFNQQELYAS